MATLATFFRRPEALFATQATARKHEIARPAADAFRLRALPNEDVFFYSKRIDNSRVVREADPRSRSQCLSTIGAALGLVALLLTALIPNVAQTLAGYQLESLRQEQQRLLNEKRGLELQEARLLSPAHLQELAARRQMVPPGPGQVVRLDPRGDSSLAMNVK